MTRHLSKISPTHLLSGAREMYLTLRHDRRYRRRSGDLHTPSLRGVCLIIVFNFFSALSFAESPKYRTLTLGQLPLLYPDARPHRDVFSLPWNYEIRSHPAFIQAQRIGNSRGRNDNDTTHPCYFQGVLKDDTCVAFNWGSTGFLKNPIALESSDRYKTRKGRNWGVPEMIEAIQQAVDEVHANHPKTKKLVIGDLSRKRGGHFPPHLSHQSGRDADIGYYLKGKYQPEYLQKIGARQLDVERTWTFLYSFLKEDKVQYIFMDYRLQRPLYKYLKSVIKLPPKQLRRYLSYPRRSGGIIRHLKGHADHLHVRFYAPQSIAAGKLYLRKHGKKVLRPVPVYYRIRRGDRLIKIAKRYRVKWRKLMRWNRLSKRRARRLRPGQRLVVGYRTPPLP